MSHLEHDRLSAGRVLLTIAQADISFGGQLGSAITGTASTRPMQRTNGRWITMASSQRETTTLASSRPAPKPHVDPTLDLPASNGPPAAGARRGSALAPT